MAVRDFVDQYSALASSIGERIGVSPNILLGQWGLETGWGKSVIPGTNNLGNIKSFDGSGVAATDNMTGSNDNYRQYGDSAAFGNDFASLLERRYKNAIGTGNDAESYAKALKSGGYAEDPAYVKKLITAANMARDAGASDDGRMTGKGNGFDDYFVDSPRGAPKAPRAAISTDGFSNDYFLAETPSAPVSKAGLMSDTGNLLKSGVNQVASGLREAVRQIPVIGDSLVSGADAADKFVTGKTSDEILKGDNERIQGALSDKMRAALDKKWWNSETQSLGDAWTDPRAYAGGIIQSLPGTLLTMIPAGRLAKMAYEAKVATLGAEEAAKAAARTAMLAGGAGEGLLSAGQTAGDVREELAKLPQSVWDSSDAYKSLIASGMDDASAKAALTNDAATKGFLIAGVTTAMFGGQGDRVLALAMRGGVSGGIRKRIVKGAIGEGFLEEAPQSYTQEIAKNVGVQTVDPTRQTTEGAFNATLGGLAVGAVQGGGMNALLGRAAPERTAKDAETLSEAATLPVTPVVTPEEIAAIPQAPAELSPREQRQHAVADKLYPLPTQRETAPTADRQLEAINAINPLPEQRDGTIGVRQTPFTDAEIAAGVERAQAPARAIEEAYRLNEREQQDAAYQQAQQPQGATPLAFNEAAAAGGDANLRLQRIQQGVQAREATLTSENPDVTGAIPPNSTENAANTPVLDPPIIGSDAKNGFQHGPDGTKYRIGVSDATGGAIALEMRYPAGTIGTFYVTTAGTLIDADGINLISDQGKLWVPKNEEQSTKVQELLRERAQLALTDPKRKTLLAAIREIVTNTQPNNAPILSADGQPFATLKAAETSIKARGLSGAVAVSVKGGGFGIRMAAPATQAIAPAPAIQQVAPTPPSPAPAQDTSLKATATLAQAIRKFGGLPEKFARDLTGEPALTANKMPGYRGLFHASGTDLSTLVHDGKLDAYLPPNLRSDVRDDSRPTDTDAAVAHIEAILRNGEAQTAKSYARTEAKQQRLTAAAQKQQVVAPVEKGDTQAAADAISEAEYEHFKQTGEPGFGWMPGAETFADSLDANTLEQLDALLNLPESTDERAAMRSMGFTEDEITEALGPDAAAGAGTNQVPESAPAASESAPASREAAPPAAEVNPNEAAAKALESAAAALRKVGRPALDLTNPTESKLRTDDAKQKRDAAEKAAKENAPSPEEFGLVGSNRAADVGAAAGQNSLFQNTASYGNNAANENEAYATDLFGDPVPSATRAPRADSAKRPALRRDAQPKPALRDTERPDGEYLASTIVGKSGERELGVSRILTAEHAAAATRYLYRSAVERFDAIVTDKNGKPLAVVGGFKGAPTQTAVYPSVVIAEAMRVPGAANIWLSHNHPSGSEALSNADIRLESTFSDALRGSGIQHMGLLAVAGDRRYSHVYDGNITKGESRGPGSATISVPVIERELADNRIDKVSVNAPDIAKQVARDFYEKSNGPGVILLDAQHKLLGWMTITPNMYGALRGKSGGLNAIYRALSHSGAVSGIIAHGGELDARIGDIERVTASQNIAAALSKVDVSPLDSINVKTGKSVAMIGDRVAEGPLFSRSDTIEVDGQQRPRNNSNGKPIAATDEGIRNFWRWFAGSRVVDDQGRPLVVYHGTTKAGFSVFDTDGKGKTAGTGAFFTQSTRGAMTYSNTKKDATISDDPEFDPKYDGESGNYPVYLRITDPETFDFDGQNWDSYGAQKEWFARDESGDIIEYFTNEADANHYRDTYDGFVEIKESLDTSGAGSTDDLAREARSSGRDGLILENITDEGPFGQGYGWDEKVWVAFSPNQIKSATNNTGQFSPDNADIRFSREAPLWRSTLTEAIGKTSFAQAPADQWKAWLNANAAKLGVKKDEIEWSGVTDWLALQKGKVTRDQVREFLDENGVKVTETMLGGSDYESFVTRMMQKYGDEWATQLTDAEREQKFEAFEAGGSGDRTKYGSYQLPGGENYRELLLTLPTRDQAATEADAETRRIREEGGRAYRGETNKSDFKSSHWDQPNILAHIRFNERADSEGKRVLFIEEIQSDWGQAGKKQGFQNGTTTLPDGWTVFKDEKNGYYVINDRKTQVGAYGSTEAEAIKNALGDTGVGLVPRAPFVGKTEAWVSLALKRMIRYAVDNGFDRIAMVNGEQSAERYDLSKQVDSIEYRKHSRNEGYQISGIKDGTDVIRKSYLSEKDLEGMVGKDVAAKIINGEGRPVKQGYTSLSGVDLKVGGEGMKAFYDRIVPQVANDVLKKLGGGKVVAVSIRSHGKHKSQGVTFGDTTLDPNKTRIEKDNGVWRVVVDYGNGDERFHGTRFSTKREAQEYIDANTLSTYAQPGFDITDKMREHAGQGMPLFRRDEQQPTATNTHAADVIAKAAKTVNIPLDVYATPQEASAKLGIYIPSDVRGLHYRGRAALISSNITTRAMGEFVLWHELFHAGITLVAPRYSNEYNRIMQDMAARNSNIIKAARDWRNSYGEETIKRSMEAGLSQEQAEKRMRLMAIEEAIADLAGANVELKGWQQFVAKLQALLRSMGFDNLANWIEGKSNAEVLQLIARTRAEVTTQNLHLTTQVPAFAREEDDASYQRAYHGTPHKFDKFSLDKIGTGEGAQAYGYGLYFASKREIAEHYRNALGRPDSAGLSRAQDLAAWAYSMQSPYAGDAMEHLNDEIARMERHGKFNDKVLRSDYEEAKRIVASGEVISNGRLYQVDIPEDSEMLHWDKPLSEQPEAVRRVIQNSDVKGLYGTRDAPKDWAALGLSPPASIKGRDVYQALAQKLSGKANTSDSALASAWLKSNSIRGIKYLDGGSRNAGDGSYNYVVFDDNDVSIEAVHSRGTNDGMANDKTVVGNTTGRSADDVISGATAASQMLDAIERDPYADYAIRVIPGEFTGSVNVGDTLPVSNKWEDGTDTGKPLRGTSGIGIEQRSLKGVEQAIHRIGSSKTAGPNGFYFGNRVVLIKGESVASGEDVGESVIQNAEVVGVWTKPTKGKSEVQPNEQTTPQEGGARSAINALSDRARYEGAQRTATPERPVKVEPASMYGAAASETDSTPKYRIVDTFGNGTRIEYHDDKRGLMYIKTTFANGRVFWKPTEIIDGIDYWLSDNDFPTLEAAIAAVRGLRISQSLKSRNQSLYGDIPNLWHSESKKIAKAIINAGYEIDDFSRSTQSSSKYMYLRNGIKVRLADHALPGHYDGADVDFRYGGNIKELLAEIAAKSNEQTTSQDGDVAFSRTGSGDIFDKNATAAQSTYNGTEAVQGMGMSVKNVMRQTANIARDKRGAALSFLGGRQIADIYSKDVPELPKYNEILQRMQAEQNEGSAVADSIIEKWRVINRKRPDVATQLSSLMHDSTLAQVDPDVSADNAELRKRWINLPQEAKDIYREARDAYVAHFEKVKAELIDRVERSALDTSAKNRTLASMREEFTKAMKGVYFPLARFGDYMVVVKDKAGVTQSVSMAETTNQAQALRAELLRAYPDYIVGAIQKKKEFNAERDGVSRGFMKDLVALISEEPDAQTRDSQLDAINQLWLSSLPDLSWAKSGIHRKGTPGYSNDAMRAFARNMFHGGYHLAKLRYGDRLGDTLAQMQETIDNKVRSNPEYSNVVAQSVVDEMNARHKHVMNPQNTPVANALTGLGFMWHMGLSPASAVVNLSQTALVAYPMLASKFGFGKAATMLLSLSADAVKGKNDLLSQLQGAEKDAYDRAVREGLIDVTMAHDLAGVSQGKSGEFNEKQQRVMRVASVMFHEAEKFNRGVTFMSAYRLAVQSGVSDPYRLAHDLTFDSHFDYSSQNRPRVMQGPTARVILLFKQYGQNMIYTLSRNTFKALQGDREAQKTLAGLLAMHGMFAGALGLPLMTTLLAAASAIGGSDDEPWDAQVALRNYLADVFGKDIGEVLAHGVFRAPGIKDAIGADISGRVGLDSMLIRMPQETLEGKKYYQALLETIAGPVFGIGGNIANGMQTMAQGNTLRGIEEMLPKSIKDPLKAYRYEQDGIQDKTGITIVDETTIPEEVAQFLGFSPARGMEGFEGKSAIKNQETLLTQRRRQLMQRYGKDAEEGDTADSLTAIQRWNIANPTMAIKGQDLLRSMREKAKRQAEAENGAYLSKKRRGLAELGEFANAE